MTQAARGRKRWDAPSRAVWSQQSAPRQIVLAAMQEVESLQPSVAALEQARRAPSC
jgi:hypothetical protein